MISTRRPSTVWAPIRSPTSKEVFETKGLLGALLDVFGPHVEYLG